MTTSHFYSLRLALLLSTTSLLACTSVRQYDPCRVVHFREGTVDQSGWLTEKHCTDSLHCHRIRVPPDTIPWRSWKAGFQFEERIIAPDGGDAGLSRWDHFTERSMYDREFVALCGEFVGHPEELMVSLLGEPEWRDSADAESDDVSILGYDLVDLNVEPQQAWSGASPMGYTRVYIVVCNHLVVQVSAPVN